MENKNISKIWLSKILENFWLFLLVFIPLATLAKYCFNASPVITFLLASLAIMPMAKYLSESTEELSAYTGPALGGLINATFGNVIEFTISIFALKAGLVEVVKASITGAIIGNLLLVLGTAIFVGGLKNLKNKEQTCNVTAAQASGSTLIFALIALMIPAVFKYAVSNPSPATIEKLSVGVAIIMGVIYIGGLLFSLYTHKHLYPKDTTYKAKWSIKKSLAILLGATITVTFMSEILVSSMEPLIKDFGLTELFIGVILVAIVGNAAEHLAAITFAMNNHIDLALQVSIGSATQIVMFVASTLVIISLFLPVQLSLIFNILELAAIGSAILVMFVIIMDGKTNWFEGLLLIADYLMWAIAFFLYH